MNKRIWAEVRFTVKTTECGTALIPIDYKTDVIGSTQSKIAELAPKIIVNGDLMQLKDHSSTYEIVNFFPEIDGDVDPNIVISVERMLQAENGTNE